MTSRGRRDIWPSLVEKAVCMRALVCRMTAHSLPVSETYGRVRFPRLVRQQFTRLDFVAVTYGLLQKLEYRYTVRASPPRSCPCI